MDAGLRYLFVADLLPDENAGGAGSLLAIGSALEALGNRVSYLWRETPPPWLPHRSLWRLFLQGPHQERRVEQRLRSEPADVVIVSQPFAPQVFEQLPRAFPHTLFLIRSHGWEERYYDAVRGHRLARSPWFQRLPSEWRTRALSRRTMRAAHGVIVPCSLEAEYLRTRYPGASDGLVSISYGLDPEFAPPERADDAEGLRLLFVGQYIRRKGIDVIERSLPALALRHPSLTATFVVQDEAVDRIRRRLGEGFGERLRVRPWVTRDELRPLYASHDVLLFPSYFDGFGKVLPEAMACGVCVVGFDEGALRDLATNGREALYCARGEAAQWTALVDRCAADPELARGIGQAARRATAQHTWTRTAEETDRWCRERRRRVLGVTGLRTESA